MGFIMPYKALEGLLQPYYSFNTGSFNIGSSKDWSDVQYIYKKSPKHSNMLAHMVEFQDYKKPLVLDEHGCRILHPHVNYEDVEKVIDTLLMARQMHPGQRNSLDVLTDRYNIQGYDRSYHGALIDSKILGEVYLSMTGGQTDLNFSSGITKKIEHETKASLSSSLIKISASAEENLAHQNYLKSIHEDNN